MISFALRNQGKLLEYIKYMVQALKINKNILDKEGRRGQIEVGESRNTSKREMSMDKGTLNFYFC